MKIGAETRQDMAERLFREGFNCSQAVFATFAEHYGIDEKTALKLSASFGGGMGRMREICGTFSAILMVAGLETGSTEGGAGEQKAHNYRVVRELAEEFKRRNKSIVCRELLGLDKKEVEGESHVPAERTAEYYKKRPCIELIRDAVDIIEKKFI